MRNTAPSPNGCGSAANRLADPRQRDGRGRRDAKSRCRLSTKTRRRPANAMAHVLWALGFVWASRSRTSLMNSRRDSRAAADRSKGQRAIRPRIAPPRFTIARNRIATRTHTQTQRQATIPVSRSRPVPVAFPSRSRRVPIAFPCLFSWRWSCVGGRRSGGSASRCGAAERSAPRCASAWCATSTAECCSTSSAVPRPSTTSRPRRRPSARPTSSSRRWRGGREGRGPTRRPAPAGMSSRPGAAAPARCAVVHPNGKPHVGLAFGRGTERHCAVLLGGKAGTTLGVHGRRQRNSCPAFARSPTPALPVVDGIGYLPVSRAIRIGQQPAGPAPCDLAQDVRSFQLSKVCNFRLPLTGRSSIHRAMSAARHRTAWPPIFTDIGKSPVRISW